MRQIKKFVLRDAGIISRCSLFINNLPKEKLWEVVVREHYTKRTINQNARYWALVGQVARVKEKSPEVIHTFFKSLILGVKAEVIDGKEVYIVGSTTKLSTKEHMDYVEQCIAYAVTEWDVMFEDEKNSHG